MMSGGTKVPDAAASSKVPDPSGTSSSVLCGGTDTASHTGRLTLSGSLSTPIHGARRRLGGQRLLAGAGAQGPRRTRTARPVAAAAASGGPRVGASRRAFAVCRGGGVTHDHAAMISRGMIPRRHVTAWRHTSASATSWCDI
jgi:hypothetical protein